MATHTTIARPYAKAAFEYAIVNHVLKEWSSLLATAAELTKDPAVKLVLNNPGVDRTKKANLLLALLKCTDEPSSNFIKLLGNNKRLNILSEIVEQFIVLQKEHEKSITVICKSVFALNPQQQEQLKKALKIRLQREINLEVQEDKELIGGAVITAGDLVIDSSVRTQLERLKQMLLV